MSESGPTQPRAFQRVFKEMVSDPMRAGTLSTKDARKRLDRAEAMFKEQCDQMIETARFEMLTLEKELGLLERHKCWHHSRGGVCADCGMSYPCVTINMIRRLEGV